VNVYSLKGQLDRTKKIFIDYVTKASGEIDEDKEKEVHELAQDLWDYWKKEGYTRKYPASNLLIRSWMSGRIDQWNHAPYQA